MILMSAMGNKPRKRFGQNFLQDQMVVQNIVASIAPTQEDHIVEIGPGRGVLTHEILQFINSLDAIEIDRDLIPLLIKSCEKLGQLRLFQADALTFDFSQLVYNQEKLRIIGNLPYNISTPLLFHLLAQIDLIKDMHFMLQQEVVSRIVAPVGTADYGRLSIMIQYYCQVDELFSVPPTAFFPEPKVNSAVIQLIPHDFIKNPAYDIKQLSFIVQQAFMHRRKTLRNALKSYFSVEQLLQMNIDPELRPQELSVAEYVNLSNSLQNVQ